MLFLMQTQIYFRKDKFIRDFIKTQKTNRKTHQFIDKKALKQLKTTQ